MQQILNIINEKGLHARASAKFVETVEQFDALMVHWEQALVASGFIKAGNPGHTLTRLRRMFMRHQLDETEVQIMRGALKHFAVGVAQQSDDRSGN